MKTHEHSRLACPADEISAYIDAELTPARELEIESHFAVCRPCAEELNLQKQFLCGLDSSLKHDDEIELPVDFARQVVANAESTVAGLRRPRERFNALFICAAMLLFGLFALGADAGRVFNGVVVGVEQMGAVGAFFAKVVYSIFLGFAIIIRAVAAQVQVGDGYVLFLPAFVGVAFVMFVSRKVLGTGRA